MAELGRHLTFIDEQLLPDSARADFAHFVAALLLPSHESIGFDARPDEDEDTRQLRAQLVDLLGRVGKVPEVLDAADRAVQSYLAGERPRDAVLTPILLRLAARHGDGALFRKFLLRLQLTRAPDEQRRYLDALAAFAQPDPLRRTLELLLTAVVPPQDLIAVVATLMAQGRQSSTTVWQFMRQHFDAIERRAPRLGWLLAPSSQLCDEQPSARSRASSAS